MSALLKSGEKQMVPGLNRVSSKRKAYKMNMAIFYVYLFSSRRYEPEPRLIMCETPCVYFSQVSWKLLVLT